MLTRILAGVYACIGAAALLASSARAQDVVTLKFHTFNPAASPVYQAVLKPWADKVMADSGGRIKVEMYPSMGLGGKPPELINQVRDGVADITFTLPTFSPGRFPRTSVFELPTITSDAVTLSRALTDVYGSHLRDTEYKDFHMLGIWTSVGNAIHSTKPINSAADLKGLKIRGTGEAQILFLQAIGAIPLNMVVTEVPQALSLGVIDAALLPYEILPSFKIDEITKYSVTLEGDRRFVGGTFIFMMNRRRYEQMPPDLRKVIDANSGVALAEKAARTWIDFEKKGFDAVRARGNKIVAFTRADSERIDKLSQTAIDNWVADMKKSGIDGAELVKAARAAIERNRK
jgi:TRAP-type C4-dicarboxylate transport system substrate-binding protein